MHPLTHRRSADSNSSIAHREPPYWFTYLCMRVKGHRGKTRVNNMDATCWCCEFLLPFSIFYWIFDTFYTHILTQFFHLMDTEDKTELQDHEHDEDSAVLSINQCKHNLTAWASRVNIRACISVWKLPGKIQSLEWRIGHQLSSPIYNSVFNEVYIQ